MVRLFAIILSFLLFLFVPVVSSLSVDFVVSDHLGSPAVVVDSDGVVAWSSDYEPFGAVFNVVGDSRYNYNSKELDDKTGLLYFDARYFDSSIGRFLSADSVLGTVDNPQEMNRYAYVINNPMKFIDPSGNKLFAYFDNLGEFATNTYNKVLGVSAFSYDYELEQVLLNEDFKDFSFDDPRKQVLFNSFKYLVLNEAEVYLDYGGNDGFRSPNDYSLNGLVIQLTMVGFTQPLGEGGSLIDFTPEIIFIHESSHASGYLKVHDAIADKLSQGYSVSEFYQCGKFDNLKTMKALYKSIQRLFKTKDLYVNILGWKETHAVALENRARELLGMKKRKYYAKLSNSDGSLYGLITPQRFDERLNRRTADFIFNPKKK